MKYLNKFITLSIICVKAWAPVESAIEENSAKLEALPVARGSTMTTMFFAEQYTNNSNGKEKGGLEDCTSPLSDTSKKQLPVFSPREFKPMNLQPQSLQASADAKSGFRTSFTSTFTSTFSTSFTNSVAGSNGISGVPTVYGSSPVPTLNNLTPPIPGSPRSLNGVFSDTERTPPSRAEAVSEVLLPQESLYLTATAISKNLEAHEEEILPKFVQEAKEQIWTKKSLQKSKIQLFEEIISRSIETNLDFSQKQISILNRCLELLKANDIDLDAIIVNFQDKQVSLPELMNIIDKNYVQLRKNLKDKFINAEELLLFVSKDDQKSEEERKREDILSYVNGLCGGDYVVPRIEEKKCKKLELLFETILDQELVLNYAIQRALNVIGASKFSDSVQKQIELATLIEKQTEMAASVLWSKQHVSLIADFTLKLGSKFLVDELIQEAKYVESADKSSYQTVIDFYSYILEAVFNLWISQAEFVMKELSKDSRLASDKRFENLVAQSRICINGMMQLNVGLLKYFEKAVENGIKLPKGGNRNGGLEKDANEDYVEINWEATKSHLDHLSFNLSIIKYTIAHLAKTERTAFALGENNGNAKENGIGEFAQKYEILEEFVSNQEAFMLVCEEISRAGRNVIFNGMFNTYGLRESVAI